MSNVTHDAETLSFGDRLQGLSPLHKAKALFMVAAFLSLALSVWLWAIGEQNQAIFVGLWVPSIHSLGALVLTGEKVRSDEQ